MIGIYLGLLLAQACSGGPCQKSVARTADRASVLPVLQYRGAGSIDASLPINSAKITIVTFSLTPGRYLLQFTALTNSNGESGTTDVHCLWDNQGGVTGEDMHVKNISAGDQIMTAVRILDPGYFIGNPDTWGVYCWNTSGSIQAQVQHAWAYVLPLDPASSGP